MAARFAGDYFGITLSENGGGDSELLKYFPDLADVSKAKKKTAYESFKRDQATYNAPKTPEAFGGFRMFEYKPRGAATAVDSPRQKKALQQKDAPPTFGGVPSFDVRY